MQMWPEFYICSYSSTSDKLKCYWNGNTMQKKKKKEKKDVAQIDNRKHNDAKLIFCWGRKIM